MRSTLRTKILLGFGAILALVLVVLAWSFVNLIRLGRASDAILKENYKSILAAENMINDLERQDSAVLMIIQGYARDGESDFRKSRQSFSEWFGRAKDNITIKGEENIIEQLDRNYRAYMAKTDGLLQMTPGGGTAMKQRYHNDVLPAFHGVRRDCIRLRDINHSTMYAASRNAHLVAVRAVWSMAGIGLAAVIVGIAVSLFLSNLFTGPLIKLMQATKSVSEGNYDAVVHVTSSDEIGLVIGEFNNMVARLKEYHDLNIKQILEEKCKSDAVIHEIDEGILVLDEELKVTDINARAAQALGLIATRTLGRPIGELLKSEELLIYLRETVDKGRPPQLDEDKSIITVKRGDDTSHYLFSITPIFAQADDMQGVALVLRDVTRFKELERLKSEFVMTASHELRTPLTTIGMSIDLLMENALERLNETERELLTAAHEEMERLKALVNDLLDLSRIESGKITMEMAPTEIGALFEKAMGILKAQAAEKGIHLEADSISGGPRVIADAGKITWVITNLISNALRYTPRGGRIRLFAEPQGARARISVSDEGVGIPLEFQTKIFEKFVRVEQDHGSETRGTGLGLTICREIVRAHGGTIWVDSAPGQGSTFTFTLRAET